MSYQNIRKIIFTGPESTGKTTAATKMSVHLDLPLVEEYARQYLIDNGPQYKMSDLYNILNKQYDDEESAQLQSEVIICDTDWLTIDIWAKEKFNKRIKPPYDLAERHYILCPPDIPWEQDPLRENPNDRERLYEIYMHEILRLGVSFEIINRR